METGAVAASETLRGAKRGRWRGWGTDWFVYGGALSPDERRLILSYHGNDTTGADQFLISAGSRVSASGRAERRCLGRGPRWPCGPGRVDIPLVDGAVAAVETGFVGAAAEDGLLRLDRRARVVERMPAAPDEHLMDFALDGARSLLYVSSCGRRPGDPAPRPRPESPPDLAQRTRLRAAARRSAGPLPGPGRHPGGQARLPRGAAAAATHRPRGPRFRRTGATVRGPRSTRSSCRHRAESPITVAGVRCPAPRQATRPKQQTRPRAGHQGLDAARWFHAPI
jgi:hypothetical protein